MSDSAKILSPAAEREWAAPYDFAAFEARVARLQRRAGLGQRFGAATLAAVMIAVTGLLLLSEPQRSSQLPAEASAAAAVPQANTQANIFAPAATMDERWLLNLPREPAVARVATRAPVLQLEDRIAWLDDSLSAALQEPVAHADVGRLRSERAQLVDALVRVRYAEQLAVQFN